MDASERVAAGEVSDFAKPGLRILVIDDDDCVGAAIRSILARHKSETVLASRAYAGIQAFASSRFDVVFVDVFMPGMCGLDVITHIRRGSSIPIVAMSGFRLRSSLNSVDYPGMAMQCGASAYLCKPFAPKQLIEAIDRSVCSTVLAKGSMQ